MESEPVLMEIHLFEARLTNGITNDGDIIPAASRTICHAESSIIITGGETLQNIHTKSDTCGSVSIAHSSYLTQVKRAKEGTWPSPDQAHRNRGKIRHIEHGRNCSVTHT
jgi:hypothetical protein